MSDQPTEQDHEDDEPEVEPEPLPVDETLDALRPRH